MKIREGNPLFQANEGERGVGCGATLITEHNFSPNPSEGQTCLEIGFGQGELIRHLLGRNCIVHGADAGLASHEAAQKEGWAGTPRLSLYYTDAARERLPVPDNTFDFAFCLETLEHVSNPMFLVCEVSRVLKPDCEFVVSIPDEDDNDDYVAGKHAYVYPGLFLSTYFERFMRQFWFQRVAKRKNGGSRYYRFVNKKHWAPEPVDMHVFNVVRGNYTEQQLYGNLLAGERN